jgi:DNA-binding response OmpR family regulator
MAVMEYAVMEGMKLLTEKDDPQGLKLMAQDWRYEAIAASDGREAWQVLQDREPPIESLDRKMPGIAQAAT